MTEINEQQRCIPAAWRQEVVRILRSGDKKKILSTQQADVDWEHTFPDAWLFNRPEAMAKALVVDGIEGRHITDMVPPCDAYEFWFFFDERKLLGKIGLLPDGQVIIIFSSHIPRKGDKL